MREVKKVLIVTNVPQDYRIAMFNALNLLLQNENIQFKVAFGADGYKRRKSKLDFSKMKFDYTILKSTKFTFGSTENTMFTYPGLLKLHREYKPDITFVIGYSPATIKLWIYSFFLNINYFIWSGSVNFKGRKDSTLRKILRMILVRRAKGFIAYGTKAKEYLSYLGAPEKKIHIAINTVDTHFFNEIAKKRINRKTNQIKQLLYLGYLTPGKKIDDLIKTINELRKLRNDFSLRIIGDGPAADSLKTLTKELELENTIIFEGFKQKSDLPPYLEQTDCFLFQTGCDIWGLVLNEAMASGLPCIVSPNAGAARDLIFDTKNGLILDFGFHQEAAIRINELLNDEVLLQKMGVDANEFIEANVTAEKSAKGFMSAIKQYCQNA